MKSQTKRFLAHEVIWLLASIIVVVAVYLIAKQVDVHYFPQKTDVEFGFLEYDWNKKKQVEDNIGYALLGYFVIAYPVRYLFHLGKWAIAVLQNDKK